MNIGIVCYPTYGGSGVIATELGLGLSRLGCNVHFISYDIPFRIKGYHERVFFHESQVVEYPLFNYPPYALSLAAKISQVDQMVNLDVVHVHYAIPHTISAFIAKLIQDNIKVVTTLHGTDITVVGNHPSYFKVTQLALKVSDGLTAVSKYLKDETENIFGRTKEIEVIYNFVDTEKYKRDESSCIKEKFAPDGEKIVTHISNFRYVKRAPEVVKIFSEIRKSVKSKLLMIGDGPERTKSREICSERGICEDVIFLGKLENTNEILCVSDLFLMPSLTESFGLSALEALSCESPVVASNVGGLPELIDDGINGFLVDKDNIDRMIEAGKEILKNDELRCKMGKRGREKAIDVFDSKKIINQYKNYYEKILGRD